MSAEAEEGYDEPREDGDDERDAVRFADHPAPLPHRPGVSVIDAAVGAGALALLAAGIPMRAAARAGRRVAPAIRRGAHLPATRGLADLSSWTLHTFAQIGAAERSRAEQGARSLIRSATAAVAADRDVGRMVRDLAGAQLDPLIDQALPLVLDRLAEQPAAVRRIVQDQSAGIAAEARETARQSARRGDDTVDALVGRLLRRRTPDPSPAPPQSPEP